MSLPSSETNALVGLDWLRLLAVGMVTFQHCASLTNRDDWTQLGPVNAGQLGVAVFLSISALLGTSSTRPPMEWFVQRLRRIYPAYWAAILLSYLLAWITGYKPFTFGQFISQMLGIGLFTHPGQLINIPTWFISILLVCYVGLFAARLTPWPGYVSMSIAVVTCWCCINRQQIWPWMHLVTFFATAAIAYATSGKSRAVALGVAGAVALAAAWFSTLFAYVGLSLILLRVGLSIQSAPKLIARLSSVSYEYYLVHGIALVGAISFLPETPRLAIAVGLLGALCLTLLLHTIVERVSQFLQLRLLQLPAGLGGRL